MSDKKDILAQELKFARLLASNDQKIRDSVLKSLKKWLNTRSQSSYKFSDNDFLRLWKGLYYCMWMSDKPLVQEELSEELGSLIHCFPNTSIGIQFFKNFLETMCLEWFGIDQWRIDKFMMLVRRVMRQMLFALKNAEWKDEAIKEFVDALDKTVFQVYKCPKGLIFHICDLYIEELAKVADGELSDDRSYLLIEPFLVYYAKQNDVNVLKHVEKTIINQLLFQSELGQSYQEKFDIWKQANFPTKSIDDLEIKYKVRRNKSFTDDDLSDGQEEDPAEEERSLDPRAGRVDVVLAEISFDALKFAESIETLRYKSFATGKSRKGLARMAANFRKFADDVFPLGIKRMPQERHDDDVSAIDLDLKAIQLAEFEKKLAIGGSGDVDSESSDFDEDLDNRKHGKLKRKSKESSSKTKDKKQKLSKLHNERFFKATEDFSQEKEEEDEEEVVDEQPKQMTMKIKKKKKKSSESSSSEEVPRKIKIQKRKKDTVTTAKESNSDEVKEKPKKAIKLTASSSPSSTTFKETDNEWNEPLQEGEVEIFVPSRKQKLKQINKNLVLNPFAKANKESSSTEAAATSSSFQTPPRIKPQQTSKSTGKRVIIALNKNKAQSENDYIKQVKQSPNLPTLNLTKNPTKSLLKKNINSLPSPINPFYQKKIGFKRERDANKTM